MSVSRKETISHLFLDKRANPAPSKSNDADRVRTGAIGAMGATLKEMAETAKQANELKKQLDEADSILEIDPSLIDPSRIADRISIDVDPIFDTLVESISKYGQQVPILLRQSPSDPNRFQIAYGRRRLRAVQTLGIKVKAIVRKLSDDELVVAQGRENLDRQDLSFIEKAYFAKNLEAESVERSVIITALGMDKSDVSRMISVANRVPEHLIRILGSAPKAGRKRWMELLDQLDNPDALKVATDILHSDHIKTLDSDQRFASLVQTLRDIGQGTTETGKLSENTSAAKSWALSGKSVRVTSKSKPKGITVDFSDMRGKAFGEWITNNLDNLFGLYEADEKSVNEQTGD